ncbi:hypothetical protein Bca4012_019065 [Brassica carinata]
MATLKNKTQRALFWSRHSYVPNLRRSCLPHKLLRAWFDLMLEGRYVGGVEFECGGGVGNCDLIWDLI